MKDAITIGAMFFSISVLMIGGLASVVFHTDDSAMTTSSALFTSRPSVSTVQVAQAQCGCKS